MNGDEIDKIITDRLRKQKKNSLKKRKTLGQHAHEILSKDREPILVLDLAQSMEKSLLENLEEATRVGQQLGDNFYIALLLRKEFFLEIVVRSYWITRVSKPTPEWDMSLWSYSKKDNKLLFHWSLPGKDAAEMMLAHESELPADQHELLGYIKRFKANLL